MAIASSLGNGLSYKILIHVLFCCIFTWTSVVLTGLAKNLPVFFFPLIHPWSEVSKHRWTIIVECQGPSLLSYYYCYIFYHSLLAIFFLQSYGISDYLYCMTTHSLWWSYLYHLFNMLSAFAIDINNGECSVSQKETGSSGKFKSKWFRDSILHLSEWIRQKSTNES